MQYWLTGTPTACMAERLRRRGQPLEVKLDKLDRPDRPV